MTFLKSLVGAAVAALLSSMPVLAETPAVRAALQLSGTVNWEADTIRHYGFDKANGFSMVVTDIAGAPAAQIALVAGEVDMIVSDWLWVARERAGGRDFVFIPYSRAVGGLMVPAGSQAKTLADLKGQKIGVAGSPIDKSWLILRAYAQKVEHFDLADSTEQVFGAPPLIYKAALGGELQGALNFWNFGARMQAAG
ncbi:MAG TPA: ABC transporter substrate-binding protein, partial [Rhizobium sp.]|nr:ABC transporter substrate-binding protein [Rhizobium sp.]